MKNSTERVVILDNFYSPYIRQAILILKDTPENTDTDVMLEAERIVSRYFHQQTIPKKKRNKKIDGLCITLALLGIVAFCLSKFI